jgi:hypothetical protein
MAGCFRLNSPLLWQAAVLLSVLFLSSGTVQGQGPLSPFMPTCPFINPPAAGEFINCQGAVTLFL